MTGQFGLKVAKMGIALKDIRRGEAANWEQVVGYMNDGTDIADSLLADRDWCGGLAVELSGQPTIHSPTTRCCLLSDSDIAPSWMFANAT